MPLRFFSSLFPFPHFFLVCFLSAIVVFEVFSSSSSSCFISANRLHRLSSSSVWMLDLHSPLDSKPSEDHDWEVREERYAGQQVSEKEDKVSFRRMII